MTAGTYERTAAVRQRNRANARRGEPCRAQTGRPGRKCPPGCPCGRHDRTPEHNTRIGIAVALTAEAKRV